MLKQVFECSEQIVQKFLKVKTKSIVISIFTIKKKFAI